MILQQHYLDCLAQASYLIADESTHTAAVIDPRRDVDVYLEEAAKLGVTIRHIILTHFHADFVAGHLELAERTNARIYLGAKARADYPFEPLSDGDHVRFGKVRLDILETPGHTPEGISILVFDEADDAEAPHAVLTGDTLFIGDVGRPDLMASEGLTAAELAGMMYDSLRDKLLPLPDETLVYPGHGAGSMCGKNLSSDTVSTLGAQRRTNYALQPMGRDEFVALLTEARPKAPDYFAYDANMNRSRHATLSTVIEEACRALSLEEVRRLQNRGATLLDTRPADAFARGHLAGALNIGLDGKFASWAGTLIDPQDPIVIVAAPGEEREAILRLGRIGFDRVQGYLEGGMTAVSDTATLMARRVTPKELLEQLEAGAAGPVVIDVRTAGEREAGRIESSVGIPLPELAQRLTEVPRDRELVLVCRSGYRSSCAASLLRAKGFERVLDLEGGMLAWEGSVADCSA